MISGEWRARERRALCFAPALLTIALVLGCATPVQPVAPAGGPPPPPSTTVVPAANTRAGRSDASIDARGAPPEATAGACSAFVRDGVLRRAAIARAVDAGLGQWLRGVEVRPAAGRGRFRGWLIERLHPDDPCFRNLDLQPGDVVLKINDRSIERPEQANEVFLDLRSASALKVDYLRDKKPRSLLLTIADD